MEYLVYLDKNSKFDITFQNKCISKDFAIKNLGISRSLLDGWLKCKITQRTITFLQLLKTLDLNIKDVSNELDLMKSYEVEELNQTLIQKKIITKGLSQKSIAQMLNITNATLTAWIKFKKLGTIPQFLKFLELLDMDDDIDNVIKIIYDYHLINMGSDTVGARYYSPKKDLIEIFDRFKNIENIERLIEFKNQINYLLSIMEKRYQLLKQQHEEDPGHLLLYLQSRSDRDKQIDNILKKEFEETIEMANEKLNDLELLMKRFNSFSSIEFK